MNQKADKELVRAIQEGDIFAYEELVKRYQRGLFSFLMRMVHDEATASDIVQNTLFKVYQVIDHVDTNKKFSTYVFEIAKNNALSYLRSRKHTISLEEFVEIADDESFFEQFFRTDIVEKVRAAVNELPPKYRDVITLYYFEDLSYEEVSKKLKIPVNTVRTHLARAKIQLRKLLSYENL